MSQEKVIVVGAGLAGLSCAFELIKRGRIVTILESRGVLGGRTASWIDDGMPVESGLHKFLGVYRALPALLEDAGVQVDDIITWVDELEIHHPGGPNGRFTTAPYHHPLGTAASLVGNNALLQYSAIGPSRTHCRTSCEKLVQLDIRPLVHTAVHALLVSMHKSFQTLSLGKTAFRLEIRCRETG